MSEERGNILLSQAQSLILPCNTVGSLSKGLALQFKLMYPSIEAAYRLACKRHVFAREGLFVHTLDSDKKIVCLPTKRHWRLPSRLEWVEEGLWRLACNIDTYGITSLAVPALGCGEGKLSWKDVYPLIVQYLGKIETPVIIYLPD